MRILNRVAGELGVNPVDVTVEPDPKGGHVARFDVVHDAAPWGESVYTVMLLAQRLGVGWTVYGALDCDPSGWLATRRGSHVRVSGVDYAEWTLLRDGGAPGRSARPTDSGGVEPSQRSVAVPRPRSK